MTYKYQIGEHLYLNNGQSIVIWAKVKSAHTPTYEVDIYLSNGLLDNRKLMAESYIDNVIKPTK